MADNKDEALTGLKEYEESGGVWDNARHAVQNLVTVFGLSQKDAEEIVAEFNPATKS